MKNKHFIVIRLGVLGDVALTTGVLHYLHTHYGYTFSIITKSIFAPLFKNNPAVHTVHELPHTISFFRLLQSAYSIAKQYPEYPLIDLHGNIRTTVFSYLWKSATSRYTKYSKERRAFVKSKDKQLSKLLTSTSVTQRYFLAFAPFLPEGEWTLPSADSLAAYIPIGEEERNMTLAKFSPPEHSIAIHPYASHKAKTWPASYWDTLCRYLIESQYNVIILGKSDKVFHSDTIPLEYNYTNRTNIRESLVLTQHAQMMITADSGLLHLATATQTPSIALFGPTTKEWGFFPPSPSYVLEDTSLACRPCSLHGEIVCPYNYECLHNIEPEYVYEKICSLYENIKV